MWPTRITLWPHGLLYIERRFCKLIIKELFIYVMYWRFPPRSGSFLRRLYLFSSIFGASYTTQLATRANCAPLIENNALNTTDLDHIYRIVNYLTTWCSHDEDVLDPAIYLVKKPAPKIEEKRDQCLRNQPLRGGNLQYIT